MGMLHWAMPHVSLQRLRMAIEMACDGGAFFRRSSLPPFSLGIIVAKDHGMVHLN
jgi:hypothetical protein